MYYDSDPFWTAFLLAFLFGVTATIVVCGLWEAWRAVRRRPSAATPDGKVIPFSPSPRHPVSPSFGTRRVSR